MPTGVSGQFEIPVRGWRLAEWHKQLQRENVVCNQSMEQGAEIWVWSHWNSRQKREGDYFNCGAVVKLLSEMLIQKAYNIFYLVN